MDEFSIRGGDIKPAGEIPLVASGDKKAVDAKVETAKKD